MFLFNSTLVFSLFSNIDVRYVMFLFNSTLVFSLFSSIDVRYVMFVFNSTCLVFSLFSSFYLILL